MGQGGQTPDDGTTPMTATSQPQAGVSSLPGPDKVGGPASVPAQLKEDEITGPTYRLPRIDRLFAPWMAYKNRVKQEHGLEFGFDYNTLFQHADGSLTGNRDAASGIFRAFADWTLVGRGTKNTGALIVKVENRQRWDAPIPPSQLGFAAGYNGITGTLFNNSRWIFSNLYWEQVLFDGRAALVAGPPRTRQLRRRFRLRESLDDVPELRRAREFDDSVPRPRIRHRGGRSVQRPTRDQSRRLRRQRAGGRLRVL